MNNFKPDYSKCDDKRKEIVHDMCVFNEKDTIMKCMKTKKACPAWKGYTHKKAEDSDVQLCSKCGKRMNLAINGKDENICWGCLTEDEKDEVIKRNMKKAFEL